MRPPKRQHNKDASVRYHNRVARQYDHIYEDAYWAFHDAVTWATVKRYLPENANGPCCDLGCGTGKWGLKLLKSGFPTTFVDHSPNMVDQSRQNAAELGNHAHKASFMVADIIELAALPEDHFTLTLAMGDPLSICSDAQQAARQMFRMSAPGGVIIATADNKIAALEHYLAHKSLDELETFVQRGKTNWLTPDADEQFALTCFTPASLRKLFERAGFEVLELTGKCILPIRAHKALLEEPGAAGRLLKLELELSRDQSTAASAAHLQIVARRPAIV